MGQRGANVDADDAGALVIEVEEARLAATGRLRNGALLEPVFGDQLIGDGGNGAPLEAGAAGQIGARNGLMLAHQVEHDAAVDVAGGLASSDAKVAQVYFSHADPG